MKSDEVLVYAFILCVLLPLGLWYFQDSIFAVLQMVDLLWLKGLSYVPFVGSYYGNVARAYARFDPSQLTYQHIWIAGNIAWRPFMVLVMAPLLGRWAWKARLKRRAQAFNKIDKAYIDKHCGIAQTAPASGARQQWTVRRWFHFYKLHHMKWGSAQWYTALQKALTSQLGEKASDNEPLIREFAEFIYREVTASFGEKTANLLPVDVMVKEASAQHFYLSTAIVRILAAARDQFGVVSPNGFRNRLFQNPRTVPIWFALNGLGRQTTHIESLGVLSHFYVEICEGAAIATPQLDNAIEGLDMYRDQLVNQDKLRDLDESNSIPKSMDPENKLTKKDQPAHRYILGETAIGPTSMSPA